jgi:thioredoxin 1
MAHVANTQAEFDALLQKGEKSIIDFYATWCGSCKKIYPYLEKKCQEKGINLIKVDVEVNEDVALKYEVDGLPTFQVIDKSGNKLFSIKGDLQATVDSAIEKAV